ncbi:Dual specificity protein phosphatase cdc14a [Actinomortierella ambigua]|nr:Dual specificity protein phosphatase cdc14a [Actinomortierella ambigua]
MICANQRHKQKKAHRTTIKPAFASLLDYFEQQAHVEVVVRLNEETYDERFFTTRGMKHVEMSFPDGSCPPMFIVRKFLALCDLVVHGDSRVSGVEEERGVDVGTGGMQQDARIGQERDEQGCVEALVDSERSDGPASPSLFQSAVCGHGGRSGNSGGVLAVHCKAGLGRTGTLIAIYLMRAYHMTAREAIAYLRIVRPGSVVGHQQTWLERNEAKIIQWKDQPLGPELEQCCHLLGRSYPFVGLRSEDEFKVEDDDDDDDDDYNDAEEDVDEEDDDDDYEGRQMMIDSDEEDEEEYEIDTETLNTDEQDDDDDDQDSVRGRNLAFVLDNVLEQDSSGFEEQVTRVLDQKLAALNDVGETVLPEDEVDEEKEETKDKQRSRLYTVHIQPRKSAAHDMQLGSQVSIETVGSELTLEMDPFSGIPNLTLLSPENAGLSPTIFAEPREMAR